MKVSKPIRKCKDMTVNTDITFQSCKITKSQNYIQYNKAITTDEGETKKDKDSDDESYRPTSDLLNDSNEEKTFDKEQHDENLQPGTKLSCILVMYCRTFKSLSCLFSAWKNMQNVPKRYGNNRRRCLRIKSQSFLAFATE